MQIKHIHECLAKGSSNKSQKGRHNANLSKNVTVIMACHRFGVGM